MTEPTDEDHGGNPRTHCRTGRAPIPSLSLPHGRALGTLVDDYPRIVAMLSPVGKNGLQNEKQYIRARPDASEGAP